MASNLNSDATPLVEGPLLFCASNDPRTDSSGFTRICRSRIEAYTEALIRVHWKRLRTRSSFRRCGARTGQDGEEAMAELTLNEAGSHGDFREKPLTGEPTTRVESATAVVRSHTTLEGVRFGVKTRRSSVLRMADDGSEKKPITVSIKDMLLNSVEAVLAAMTARAGQVAHLESEVQRLRSENEARMRSEIAQLRRRIQQLEGNHEVLPVAVVPATVVVDLSRVDTSIVANVASFLGKPRELLNLALTCKSFGWPEPASSSLNLSLVEGVACRAVCSRATDAEMSSLPAYTRGTATWLSILNGFEHLLDFDVLLANGRRFIEYKNGDPSVVCGRTDPSDIDNWDITGVGFHRCTAVTSGYVMTSGVHFAQFDDIMGMPCIGIVRPMPGLDADLYLYCGSFGFVECQHLYGDFLAQRSDDWGGSNIHA
ncbi:hypothetical protein THAOC_11873, partial [Thalassiosira oceanica]